MAAGDFHDAWVRALDELELDVAKAEEVLRSGDVGLPDVAPWTAPRLPGSLPLDLRPRAEALLERQLRTAEALSGALHAAGRQRVVAERFGSGTQARAMYIDQSC